MRAFVRVQDAQYVGDYRVRFRFTDATERVIDLRPFLRGPVFEPLLQDRAAFESFRVDARAGTIVWPNGADIDPDVLYRDLKPAWMHESQPVTK